jgi:preprotein translocase subunit YajC
VNTVLGILVFVVVVALVVYLAARRDRRQESSDAEYRKGVDTGPFS